MTTTSGKKKIAVLGGGVGAMSAVFALTDPDNPARDHYEITVYQMGWRLGGKGASGRNLDPAFHSRIEEHGLHIWFGFYDNAFRLMRRCYAELSRPAGVPLARWDEAFKPYDHVTLKEYNQRKWTGTWLNWSATFPRNGALPGDKSEYLSVSDYITTLLQWLQMAAAQSSRMSPAVRSGLALLVNVSKGIAKGTDQLMPQSRRTTDRIFGALGTAFKSFSNTNIGHWSERSLLQMAEKSLQQHWNEIQHHITTDNEERRAWISLNLIYANLRGIIEDRLFVRGFDAINHLDYREWLKLHAIDDGGLMIASPGVNSVYDSVFAYKDGDTRCGPGEAYAPASNLEAGTTLRAGLRQLMYEGAYMWKMQAGMGDVVFGPMYQVLKARGVKFKFFHRVRQLHLSPDGACIDGITIGKQANLDTQYGEQNTHPHMREDQRLATQDQEYQPLVDIKGLPCWPNRPLYEQLLEGEQLERMQIKLEEYDTRWSDVETLSLKRGEDFDQVLLGISLGALPQICGELIDASPKWQNMVKHVKTVGTQACQFWMHKTAREMGWEGPEHPLVSAFSVTPLNTWADMTYLVERESWHANPYPLHLAYFCGPFYEPPYAKHLKAPIERVKDNVRDLLQRHMPHLWPNSVSRLKYSSKKQFKWDLLIDNRSPIERDDDPLSSQYVRVNIAASERYVLSVAGSSKYRLPSHNPHEFHNLILAGDWTQNGLNLGCVEAATMSGLLASNAISQYPSKADIVGLDFGASIEQRSQQSD